MLTHPPSFLVLGAMKSGTTALHHYLSQHPDIYLPRKQEPSYFSFPGTSPNFRGPGDLRASINTNAITDARSYEALFDEARPGQVRGEVSPVYLYWPPTARNIHAQAPDVRLIAILRDPTDRAYSSYMHAVREGREPADSFAQALELEPERIRENWGFIWRYRDLGRYAVQLRRYLDLFPAHRLRIVWYEDLQADPVALCQSLYRFLGVDDLHVPDVSVRWNPSGVPRSRTVQRLTRTNGWLRPAAQLIAPAVGADRLRRLATRVQRVNLRRVPARPEERQSLRGALDADVAELEQLLDRNLDHWRTGARA